MRYFGDNSVFIDLDDDHTQSSQDPSYSRITTKKNQ